MNVIYILGFNVETIAVMTSLACKQKILIKIQDLTALNMCCLVFIHPMQETDLKITALPDDKIQSTSKLESFADEKTNADS